jgi:hypothetical protein
MILGAMDQKLWMVEVFRRSLGREGELTTCAKSGRQEEKKKFKKSPGRRPRAGGRLAVAPRPRLDTWIVPDCPLFMNFLIFCNFIFWKFKEWAKAFERMDVQHLHFLKLAPTLGSVKCSIPQGDWKFVFFHILFFLNLDYTWTFITTIGDLVQ